MLLRTALFSLFIIVVYNVSAQSKKEYSIAAIGFYNFENLYDTVDDPITSDEEFLPDGKKKYTEEVYREKLKHLSEVISKLGTELTPDGLAILGTAEIENGKVLTDLLNQPAIAQRGYKFVQYNSPDQRGVDVALIYSPKYLTVKFSKPITVHLKDDKGNKIDTRDILWVCGNFLGSETHFFVNHWPSRRGGEEASAPRRKLAAQTCRSVIDSLLNTNQDTRIIVMGDLNDDPVSPSVAKVLKANGDPESTDKKSLYNPYFPLYRNGIGTLAWNDSWNLFDQVIFSRAWLNKTSGNYYFYKPRVFNEDFLKQQTGNFKGYPWRTYVGDEYVGGYSDHFPVFCYVIKEK